MKTIKGLLGYVGFGVSAIISQGRQSLGPGIWRGLEKGAGGKQGPPPPILHPHSSDLRKLLRRAHQVPSVSGVWAITQFFRLVLHQVNKPGEQIKPNTED